MLSSLKLNNNEGYFFIQQKQEILCYQIHTNHLSWFDKREKCV